MRSLVGMERSLQEDEKSRGDGGVCKTQMTSLMEMETSLQEVDEKSRGD